MKKLSHLTRSSLLVAAFFGLDKILAFGRSILIARQFGLSVELDAFNAANNLPDLLFAMISGGALAMAVIPILTETLTISGRQAAWNLFSRVANFGFLITAMAAIVIAIFADQIVGSEIGIVPGFTRENQALVAGLMRLNLIATIIFSISGLVMAGLQANQHFLLPAMAPSLYNLGMIFGALVLSPEKPYAIGPITLPAFGLGVHGLVYGVILGAALHLGIQVPGLVKYGFRWTASLNIRDTGMLEVIKVLMPRLLTMLGIQLTFIARDNLASNLPDGSISALTYGWMIMQVPETLIGTAIATALLPTLSEMATRHDWAAFRETLEKAVRVLLALTVPVAAVMAAGINPLVRAAFDFGTDGTAMLTWTARVYLLSLTGYTVHEVVTRSFYARKEAWFPLIGVAIRLVLFIGTGIVAVQMFSSTGAPAIAFSELALTVETVVLFALLNRRLPDHVRGGSSLLRGLLAASIGGSLTYALATYLPGGAVSTALLGMAAGGLVSLAIVWKDVRLLFKM